MSPASFQTAGRVNDSVAGDNPTLNYTAPRGLQEFAKVIYRALHDANSAASLAEVRLESSVRCPLHFRLWVNNEKIPE